MFLINLVLANLALASSGIAATLIEGRKTAHSILKLPLIVVEQEYPVCDITRFSACGQLLM